MVIKLSPLIHICNITLTTILIKFRFESPMGTHDPKDIDEEVNSSWKLVSHLENEFCDIPAARELVINVRVSIFAHKV
jgi:hypothetical protein